MAANEPKSTTDRIERSAAAVEKTAGIVKQAASRLETNVLDGIRPDISEIRMYQFLPEQIRNRLHMRMSLGFGGRRNTIDQAMRGVQSSNLLDAAQMRELFPDAAVVRERFGPITKSLMAIVAP